VAIVTGSAKGIGRGIALEMARAGAKVVVNYNSDKNAAMSVLGEIADFGGTAVSIQGDISNKTDAKKLIRETIQKFGQLDVLVNNAAVYSFGALPTLTEEEFHLQYNTNVWGVINTIQEAEAAMEKNGGSIINIGGIISTNPYANASLYAGTKAAVDVITLSLARELAAKKIRVNVIAPGATATEAANNLEGERKRLADKVIAETPMGRLGKIEEIGQVAVFLASDASAWITGESIRVGGGLR
jgi:3-oxoacyl-[acyl-carrier protein] reductase